MGRAPRGRRECEDERTQPAKRPANWEGELPEDPILASQLPKVSKASGARGLVDRPPTAVKKVPKIQESGGSKAPGLQQYDLLAALGIKRRSTGEETEAKRQKKETRTPMQLFQQLATKMWKPKKHPPLEGIIEERSEGNLQELGSTSEVPSFQVRLKTSGPGPAKRVTFSGAAARAFHRSLGLQRGGRIQIQGYTSSVRDGMEELHFQDVHPGVCIKVVATAAMSTSEEVLQLGDLVKHLEKVKSRKAKAVVTVEAIAKQVGKLQHEELAMQPGEFAAVRSIELQCPSSNTTCQWRLWDAQAEQFGEALKGHRLRINGTRVRDAQGQPELTGCASMSITS